ncbi:MAG: undecaprenyldiphospho-muramoylpentapeptide beta-N-acetylglucosaminyltransferase [Bacteroidetes bacterium]|nr:undecaprenyldiphospho-muramoylpentapeptide beta-N-acetylglucosaminyltransferase [Bacteroidota bacterium]
MTAQKQIKVIIAGGGTGGHIFPAVAIANALRRFRADADILFVGAKGKMEMEKVPKEGYRIIGLDIAGLNRSSLIKNVLLPFKLIRSFLQASSVLKTFKPDIAIGVGGYASFPVLFMAQQKGIPTLIQEQNSIAGKSNRILGSKANSICVAYENMDQYFPKEKLLLTGNPVRESIISKQISREEGLAFFGLQPTHKTIFAFGGSLGAKSINDTLAISLANLKDENVQLIWQTGTSFYQQAIGVAAQYKDSVKVYDFIREMEYAYAAADVIIARSGALSVAELCLVGKPVVFVPFPFASEDHQTFNAMALVNHKAAMMVKDSDTKSKLIQQVILLLRNESECKSMRENIKSLAFHKADEKIVNKVLEIIQA